MVVLLAIGVVVLVLLVVPIAIGMVAAGKLLFIFFGFWQIYFSQFLSFLLYKILSISFNDITTFNTTSFKVGKASAAIAFVVVEIARNTIGR